MASYRLLLSVKGKVGLDPGGLAYMVAAAGSIIAMDCRWLQDRIPGSRPH